MLSPGGCFKTLGSDNRDREKVLLLLCKLGTGNIQTVSFYTVTHNMHSLRE